MFLNIDAHNENKIALTDDTGETMSYGQLQNFILNFKNVMPTRSVVFILCSNTIGAVATFLACIENKVVPLLLGKDLDRDLLRNLIDVYQPQYLIVPGNMEVEFNNYILVSKINNFLVLYTKFPQYAVNEELSFLLTTSGSTGSPKLVRHSYKNVYFSYKQVAEFFGFTANDIGLADLPINYTMGLSVICSHLYAGSEVVLTDYNLINKEFWKIFNTKGITDITGVPFSYEVLDKLGFFLKDYPTLKILAEGGGRMNDVLFQKVALYCEQYSKKFYATFGTTETTARLAYLDPALAISKICSIGRAIPGGQLSLLDVEQCIPIEEMIAEGELAYRGDNVTMGYANCKEDLNKNDERKGYYITGDIAKRDKDGCYYIIGRISRFLKLYGLRISLDQCENIISDEFKIDCACLGNDQKMIIFLENKEILEEVVSYISKKLGLYKKCFVSKYIEHIPRNNNGKVMYSQLKV